MEMVLKMDAGDVIAVEKVPLSSDMNFLALEKKLLSTACDLLLKVIKKFDDYFARKVKQDESLVTYAEKITSEDLKINWNDSAEKCFNKVRAFSPSPGAWSYVLIGGDVKRIKIKKCDFISSDEVDPPGTAVIDNKSLSIVCRAGRIHVHDLQIEGKNSTSAQDFVNGLRTPVFFK
jgi:methionyl-tRNA formyltransferase